MAAKSRRRTKRAKTAPRGVSRAEPRRKRSAFAWGLGAAALGIGAGLAAERWIVGRRRRPDSYASERYGSVTGDRRYEIVTDDGATLVVDEVGPPGATAGAVFLHGFCLDRTIWHHQYHSLAPDKRYLFFDARHHGLCRGGTIPSDTVTLAHDLNAVLARSGLAQVVLVGHSMGGMTVLEYCREHPESTGARIRGLVLVNTTYTDALKTVFAAEFIGPLERRLRKMLERLLVDPRSARAVRIRSDDLSWLLTRLGGFGSGASASQVEFVQRLVSAFPSPPLVDIMRGLRAFDMEAALHTIDVPTLIIAGGTDRITTVRASQHMAREIPGAQLEVLEGAGHMTMLERHREFNRLVGGFIEDVLSGRRARDAPPEWRTA